MKHPNVKSTQEKKSHGLSEIYTKPASISIKNVWKVNVQNELRFMKTIMLMESNNKASS